MTDAAETPTIEPHSDLLYARVSRLVFGQPLLVLPDVAETIGNFLRLRMEGIRPETSRFVGRPVVDQSGEWRGYRREGSVGIVSVIGELVNRGAWLGASSGLTSYEGILQQVTAAAADPEVRSIVLDVNSPGGEAYGMSDTARAMRSAAAGKRMVAVINSIGASAAYGLASAADEVVITESGVAGSIGVVVVHFDQSERAAKLGVKATVITAGKSKATGHPFAPLDEDARASIQSKVDRIMDGFVKLVADHRSKLKAKTIREQQGDTYLGADAVSAGLADRVGNFADVIAELSGRPTRAASARDARLQSVRTDEPAAAADLDQARADGATHAATRIAGIVCSAAAEGRQTFARHLAFKTSMTIDEAIAALEASATEATGRSLASMMGAGPDTALGVPPSYAASQPQDSANSRRERGRQIALKSQGKA